MGSEKASKVSIRSKFKQARDDLDDETIRLKSARIAENLANLFAFKQSKRVLFYLSTAKEVQTDGMIASALDAGKKVCVPIVDAKNHDLLISELKSLDDDLEVTAWGIREPRDKSAHRVSPSLIDCVVVPGVVFDRKGRRIGLGGGYYDRFLRQFAGGLKSVAVAFDFQVVDALPQEDFDVAVQTIVTESQTINC